jgi:plastocyanin
MRRFRLLAPMLLGAPLLAQGPPVDRVGFPSGYENWPRLYVFDRPDVPQVRTVYGNVPAASVRRNTVNNFPYGSVLVMEVQNALRDASGRPLLDSNGRNQKDPAAQKMIFVMKKDVGFGAEYGANRSGEWEYVSYRPDGTYLTPPLQSFPCAACHRTMGPENDWTARVADLYLKGGSGGTPTVVMKAYQYMPQTVRVKAGTTMHFYNDDPIDHTITTPDLTGDSGRLNKGQSYEIRLDAPGEYDFFCTLHANMRMKIVVER